MDLGGTVGPFCQQFNLMGLYHGGGHRFTLRLLPL